MHGLTAAVWRHTRKADPGRAGRRDRWRDVAQGADGAAVMMAGLLTPFGRGRRGSWGAGAQTAARRYLGDDLVPRPRWGWTHGIQVEAPAADVWPWVAQIGADRGGFYSYQWLENLIGCQIRNAGTIHPEWAAREGGELRLHPKAPPLRIVSVEPGRALVAYMAPVRSMSAAARQGGPDASAPARKKDRWMTASWLFLVGPAGPARCRVLSRYRCDTSDDLPSRLQFGPAIIEPVSFAMDRRMLIGIKQRAEHARDSASRQLPLNAGAAAGAAGSSRRRLRTGLGSPWSSRPGTYASAPLHAKTPGLGSKARSCGCGNTKPTWAWCEGERSWAGWWPPRGPRTHGC